METPRHSDIFRDWNLGSHKETVERQDLAKKPAKNWDLTQDFKSSTGDSINPADDFTLTPELHLHFHPIPLAMPPGHSQDADTREAFGEPRKIGGGGGEGPLGLDAIGKPSAPLFPLCGEGIGGFRLISELGRGAFGRVYLAQESGLGNRSVALKITKAEGDEPKLLARLQHTHIVPIHSVHDDPETGLRLMCMPYFGGANLAQVLDATGGSKPGKTAGRSLVEALDIVGKFATSEIVEDANGSRHLSESWSSPGEAVATTASTDRSFSGSLNPLRSILGRIPWWSRASSFQGKNKTRSRFKEGDDRDPVQPARRFLREASFARASAWIAARLAEGLEHAHSRGLLHRDLKPSNILVAADGTPMLLDFNLAADAVHSGDANRAMIGGTLPYMSPEHLDAFNPWRQHPARGR